MIVIPAIEQKPDFEIVNCLKLLSAKTSNQITTPCFSRTCATSSTLALARMTPAISKVGLMHSGGLFLDFFGILRVSGDVFYLEWHIQFI